MTTKSLYTENRPECREGRRMGKTCVSAFTWCDVNVLELEMVITLYKMPTVHLKWLFQKNIATNLQVVFLVAVVFSLCV